MLIRLSKCALLAAIALFYSLVVLGNLTDYESNHQFVQHVLSMDTTFAGNHGMWRSITSQRLQTLFYITIIAWEFICAVLCWWAAAKMFLKLRSSATEFEAAKPTAIAALTLGLLMWFVAFLTIGGEWFMMWQSRMWNGQEEAFRMFTILGIVLIYIAMPETGAAERST
jgi:predicted small integral membrane protein